MNVIGITSAWDFGTDSWNRGVDYFNKTIIRFTDLSNTKKLFQFIKANITLADYLNKTKDLPLFIQSNLGNIQGFTSTSNDLIGFFDTYENMIHWLQPYGKKSIDEHATLDSLKQALSNPENPNLETLQDVAKKADKIFGELFQSGKKYWTKKAFNEDLTQKLRENGYGDRVDQIKANFEVKQQSRLFSIAVLLFTISDLGDNILTLHNWGALDLQNLAVQIGSKIQTFHFVAEIAIKPVLKLFFCGTTSLALAAILIHNGRRMSQEQAQLNQSDREAIETKRYLEDEKKTLADLRAILEALRGEKRVIKDRSKREIAELNKWANKTQIQTFRIHGEAHRDQLIGHSVGIQQTNKDMDLMKADIKHVKDLIVHEEKTLADLESELSLAEKAKAKAIITQKRIMIDMFVAATDLAYVMAVPLTTALATVVGTSVIPVAAPWVLMAMLWASRSLRFISVFVKP